MYDEISVHVTSYIAESPVFGEWPECRHMLINILADDQPWIHALPILSCKAVGGENFKAIPGAAAWITLVHAANLIDDIQDGDFISVGQFKRPDIALTYAIAWVFTAFRMLDDPSLDVETRNRVTAILAQAGFNSSMGQAQDLLIDSGKSDSNDLLQMYWNTVILKSGNISMAGVAVGAAIGTNSIELVEALSDYGTALGVIRQVIDDCRDYWNDSSNNGKVSTLLTVLRSMVLSQQKEKPKNRSVGFRANQNEISRGFTEAGIPEIIADILLEWRRRALAGLHVLEPSEARDALEGILEHALILKR